MYADVSTEYVWGAITYRRRSLPWRAVVAARYTQGRADKTPREKAYIMKLYFGNQIFTSKQIALSSGIEPIFPLSTSSNRSMETIIFVWLYGSNAIRLYWPAVIYQYRVYILSIGRPENVRFRYLIFLQIKAARLMAHLVKLTAQMAADA